MLGCGTYPRGKQYQCIIGHPVLTQVYKRHTILCVSFDFVILIAFSLTPLIHSDHDEKGDEMQTQDTSVNEKQPWLSRILLWSLPTAPHEQPVLIPEATANCFSVLTFGWLTSLMTLGYSRPLEASDLYKLQDSRSSSKMAAAINESYDRRVKVAAEYNARLERGEISPGLKALWWTIRGNKKEREKRWREIDGQKKASLTWAMNDSVKWWFWSAAILEIIADTAQVTSPMVVKAIITFASESYYGHLYGVGSVPPIETGLGLVFGLLGMQVVASLCLNHSFYRSASTGVLLRGGLITAIYSRSLRLTSKARSTLTNGKLVNHISTDVSRIDFCAGFFHMAWTAPIQLIICLILLLVNLGPSALVGFTFFFVVSPPQMMIMKRLFALRRKSMEWTDKRAKLLQELLGGIKVIKFFVWEVPFLERIFDYRRKEMKYIRSILLIRSANNAIATSTPTLAAVLTFITYSATGHQLSPANIFSSLALFNLLKMPIIHLPRAFSTIADAANAISRLRDVFEAEVLGKTYEVDDDLDVALDVQNASWTWDPSPPEPEKGKKKPGHESTVDATNGLQNKVFKIQDVSMNIPRGKLVAVVGPIGSGKSSLLQGLLGEMRMMSGKVTFGGSVSYCPQTAWIQNATVRENVCFGRPFEEERYWKAIKDSCLELDLAMLPHGDLTEVGERGISLSGGQKQRINVCRALYFDTDVQIFDDPLSALDSHVGSAVFHNVLKNVTAGKTRILVTHALHFLPQVDYIYVVAGGRVAEHGSYSDLMATEKGEFARFMNEFATKEEEDKEDDKAEEMDNKDFKTKNVKHGAALMQAEERNIGAVPWPSYKVYLSAGKGVVILPFLFLSLALFQGVNVMSSYWLVYWQEDTFNRPDGFYMSLYAMLGGAQAVAAFLMGSSFAMLTYFASQRLHKDTVERVMQSPTSFFETTPLGRIMNRFSKDVDTIDNKLGDGLRMLTVTILTMLGAVILIAILLPWFLVGVAVIVLMYAFVANFYRSSARELMRIDALLRSSLYSHFSESLTGLSTIRAYGEIGRFQKENETRIDVENRAYWLTVTNQRWLGVRVDFMGALLTFIVGLLTVGMRFTISPSQTGIVLSYILGIQQSFGWVVRQMAEVENDMNSVERLVYYAREIEQEAPHELPNAKPSNPWPAEGKVELDKVVLSYRPGLPVVLKGITMSVEGGEKIGIVGRTGAGKSSLMTALYRLVEFTSGSIRIDGVDISKIGLKDLRSALAIIPQDPLLFSGTLRTNLDPFGLHSDSQLWDALKRSHLVNQTRPDFAFNEETLKKEQPSTNCFTLDTIIDDEGANLSVGQRSLVSLARALVKNSRIIILDEATASVDYETDRKIQDTIAYECQDRTILCIAHRLRTIISYDRICVLDAGQIAEFDTPERLYHKPNGIFRGMCQQSSITLDDIKNASVRLQTLLTYQRMLFPLNASTHVSETHAINDTLACNT